MRVLIIEDDIKLCDSLKYQLEQEQFTVDICHDGEDGLHFIRQQAHDLILLDRMLPSLDGIKVLSKTRNSNISTPVILITALGELDDKIMGLDCGADDYMVKPFAFKELLARIRSISRRPSGWKDNNSQNFGDLVYDHMQKKLSSKNKQVSLSKREGALLDLFMKNPEQTLPRMLILSRVWGPDAEVEDGNLDNYIHFLRRRLKQVDSCLSLVTVRGVGYRLEAANV